MFNRIKIYGHFIGNPISTDELFSGIPPETKQFLGSLKQLRRIPKGEIVPQIGGQSSVIYFHKTGRAQMSFDDDLGSKKTSRPVAKKEIIGLRQLFAQTPGEMCLETLSACHFEIIEHTDFIDFLKGEPQICFRLVYLLSSDLQQNYQTFSNSDY
jgi:CRP-like cAMP-binding protein